MGSHTDRRGGCRRRRGSRYRKRGRGRCRTHPHTASHRCCPRTASPLSTPSWEGGVVGAAIRLQDEVFVIPGGEGNVFSQAHLSVHQLRLVPNQRDKDIIRGARLRDVHEGIQAIVVAAAVARTLVRLVAPRTRRWCRRVASRSIVTGVTRGCNEACLVAHAHPHPVLVVYQLPKPWIHPLLLMLVFFFACGGKRGGRGCSTRCCEGGQHLQSQRRPSLLT
eukprot:514697-Rhodomonas_salina.2